MSYPAFSCPEWNLSFPAGKASWELLRTLFAAEFKPDGVTMAFKLSHKALWPTKFEKYVYAVKKNFLARPCNTRMSTLLLHSYILSLSCGRPLIMAHALCI
jgi:hypothetical protein